MKAIEAALQRQVDPGRIEADLRDLIQARSVTGDEGAAQDVMLRLLADAGVPAERLDPDPAEARRDPDWPGEEVERTTLPIVIGRLGQPGRRRICWSGTSTWCHPAIPRPGPWTRGPARFAAALSTAVARAT